LGLSYYTAREILRCGEQAPLGLVATIGRLQPFLLPPQITALRSAYGLPAAPWSTQAFGGFSEDFFRAAGASSVVSIDASAYEGAEIVHDMNAPTPPELECKFDLVVDGGSIEHIFRPDRAVANVMRMTKVGGHVIIEAPARPTSGNRPKLAASKRPRRHTARPSRRRSGCGWPATRWSPRQRPAG
jgi:SAM-dependent methyltransferase